MPISERLQALFGHAGQRISVPKVKLPRSVVTHDSIDQLEYNDYAEESPRFHRMTVDDAPVIVPDVPEPEMIDITTASQEEIAEYQQEARKAKAARDQATPYRSWADLTRDVFYSYHSRELPKLVDDPVDPGVELHKRILPKLYSTDDHAQSRNVTREDPAMSALATMAVLDKLKDTLSDELLTQAQESQEFEEQREAAQGALDQLQGLRDEARGHHEAGQPIPQALREEIQQAVGEKRQAQEGAANAAAEPTPMSSEAAQAIAAAAAAGAEAAESGAGIPSFGQGFGKGEPHYKSPEQALSIAEQWTKNPDLKAMAEMFGRLDRDIRFHRSKRVVGGQDEIVDVRFGDVINRITAGEWALFADEDMEDDFLARFAGGELLTYSTVGEEHAGRGPILMVVDGSGSMDGQRNIWARAISMALLHIARAEKRDFALIEFSTSTESWSFPAKAALDPEELVNMCSHFFGGGTLPILGVQAATKMMADAPEFKKADLVLVGDGEAGFGDEDARLKNQLNEMGVRLWGIGIGGSFNYLDKYCEYTVPVSDFDLSDPSDATTMLATHIT